MMCQRPGGLSGKYFHRENLQPLGTTLSRLTLENRVKRMTIFLIVLREELLKG